MTALMGLLGLGFGTGVLLIIAGCRRVPPRTPPVVARWRRILADSDHGPHATRWLLAAGAVGIGVGAATGWIVGGILAGVATWGLPRVLGSNTDHARRVARIEAIASWAE